MSRHFGKLETFEMKSAVLSFALVALLFLAPVDAAASTRTLWVGVGGAVSIVEEGVAETRADQFRSAGMDINAFRVTVGDGAAPDGVSLLALAYQDASGAVVADDVVSDTRPLDFADGGAAWAPVSLADYDDRDLVVTLALGHVDWAAFDARYDEADSSTWSVEFAPLAVATETLGNLLDAPHASRRSDIGTPAFVPWTPDRFTASWAVPLVQRATGTCEDMSVSLLDLSSLGLRGLSEKAAVSNTLNTMQANGCRSWENIVLGNAQTNFLLATVPTVGAGSLGLALPASNPGSVGGYDVLYELRRSGSAAAIQAAASSSDLAIPLYPDDRDGERDPTGIYRVWTLLVPQSNPAITNAIPSTNAVGVLKVASTLENTATAIPWTALASDPLVATNIAVSAVVHPANIVAGDRVFAFDPSDGVYRGWTMTASGWSPMSVVTVDGVSVTPAPESWRLAPGTAVWVSREAPCDGESSTVAKPFFVYGQVPAGDYAVTLAAGSAAAPASTLCANPTVSSVALSELGFEGDIGADDTIVFNTASGVSIVYVHDAARGWGRWQKTVYKGRIKSEWIADGIVAPGAGFWYVRRASGALSVRWPGWEE